MAKPVNQVVEIGNVVREPEMRFLPNGIACLNFTIGVNHSKKNAAGEWEDIPNFFDVTAFDTLAENATETLVKGTRVIVIGRLSQRSWETDEGDKRSKVEILANNIGIDLAYATATVSKVERTDG